LIPYPRMVSKAPGQFKLTNRALKLQFAVFYGLVMLAIIELIAIPTEGYILVMVSKTVTLKTFKTFIKINKCRTNR
jgi:hypothetical protein